MKKTWIKKTSQRTKCSTNADINVLRRTLSKISKVAIHIFVWLLRKSATMLIQSTFSPCRRWSILTVAPSLSASVRNSSWILTNLLTMSQCTVQRVSFSKIGLRCVMLRYIDLFVILLLKFDIVSSIDSNFETTIHFLHERCIYAEVVGSVMRLPFVQKGTLRIFHHTANSVFNKFHRLINGIFCVLLTDFDFELRKQMNDSA